MNRPDQVLRQWEQQKEIQKKGDPMLKLIQQMVGKPAPKPKAKAKKKK